MQACWIRTSQAVSSGGKNPHAAHSRFANAGFANRIRCRTRRTDFSAAAFLLAHQHFQEGGFAAAAGPENTDELAGVDDHVHVAQQLALFAAEKVVHPVHPENQAVVIASLGTVRKRFRATS